MDRTAKNLLKLESASFPFPITFASNIETYCPRSSTSFKIGFLFPNVEITTKDYLALVEEIYKDKGGIKEQREPLKTSSAMRIRKQMVKDIKAGTVLPPIVLGLIIPEADFQTVTSKSNEEISGIIEKVGSGNLTIIDGMQRTTALLESIEEGLAPDKILRVEFWISTKLNSLIYRMLVLNTGQVPCNLRRQVETVFSTMINEMNVAVPEMEVFKIDEGNRRTKGGQYHANDLIELKTRNQFYYYDSKPFR